MAVVIADSLVLSTDPADETNADNPVVGYHNIVTTSNVAADTEASGTPVTNVANPATHLKWTGVMASPEADEHLTVTTGTADAIDYLAVARHNFKTAGITVSVEKPDGNSPMGWEELVAETLPDDDAPLLFRWDPEVLTQVRLRMQPGTAAPSVAVLYVGKLLVLQRRLYVGHNVARLNLRTRVANGRSEAGDFLGRIVLSQSTATKVTQSNLKASWARTNLKPFYQHAEEEPFFFAWRPNSYPKEVEYAWLTDDPTLTNQRANGMMQAEFSLAGIRT